MRRRKKGPRHWVVVPALASVGITLVAYGQNLVLEDVSMAVVGAPAPTYSGRKPADNAQAKAGGQQPASSSVAATAANPEFGGPAAGTQPLQQAPARIRSTSQDELVRKARENAGREDPFVALLLPQAVIIQPVFIPTPPPQSRTIIPQAPRRRVDPVTQRTQVFQDGRWEDEIISVNPDEPRWTVQGILNTGRESLVILEVDGVTREAHIGEVLEDGAKVVAISGSQVTLLSHGRRYVKQIGGLDIQ